MHANPVFETAHLRQLSPEEWKELVTSLMQQVDKLEGEVQQVKDDNARLQAEVAELKREDTSTSSRVQAVEEQLAGVSRDSQRMQQQLSAIEPQPPAKFVVHAPLGYTPEQVKAGIQGPARLLEPDMAVRCIYAPSDPPSVPGGAGGSNGSGNNNSRGSGDSSSGGGSGSNGGSNTSSSGNNGGSTSRGRRTAVFVVSMRSGDDVRAILSGRTRAALKAANLPLFVDSYLSQAQRERRKQLQPTQRQLRSRGVHTRWVVDELQQKVQDQQGRWSWQPVGGPET